MIGLGTQSDFDEAKNFTARYGITFRMFWDNGFDSWDGFEVWGQPTSILISRSGTKLKRWTGAMSDRERTDAAREARAQG